MSHWAIVGEVKWQSAYLTGHKCRHLCTRTHRPRYSLQHSNFLPPYPVVFLVQRNKEQTPFLETTTMIVTCARSVHFNTVPQSKEQLHGKENWWSKKKVETFSVCVVVGACVNVAWRIWKEKLKNRQRRATDDPEEVMQRSLLISQPNLLNPLLFYSSIILSPLKKEE